MSDGLNPKTRQALEAELCKLKHLKRTRMLSLDDGLFVRGVVSQMDGRIAEIQATLGINIVSQ